MASVLTIANGVPRGTKVGDNQIDSFSGNGITTSFSLAKDPGAKNNTWIWIDGVYQNKSTYSLSGTTITFGEAPPVSSSIEVVSAKFNVLGPPQSVPAGTIVPFAGSVAPDGYLFAQGQTVSRFTYNLLFDAIGTTYGAGDGTTTFQLPDTRNVFLRGANASTRTIGGISYPAVTLGSTTNDKFQGHWHSSSNTALPLTSPKIFAVSSGSSDSVYSLNNDKTAATASYTSDGTNGTPRTGSETAPVNLGVNFIICYRPQNTSSGSGGSQSFDTIQTQRNYLKPDFDSGVSTGWSLFTTTLTSGLPTGSISAGAASLSMSVTATNPLSGTNSLQVSSASAATAGQGIISDAFTVDRIDQAKVLFANYMYEVVSGASNLNLSGILGSQSIAAYIYDVNNSVWIQPSGFLGMNQSIGPAYSSPISFQTAALGSGGSYRFALLFLQSSAGAMTVNLDHFQLGPKSISSGVPASDPIQYAVTIGSTTTPPTKGVVVTDKAVWSRIGNKMKVTYTYQQSSGGNDGSGAFLFPIPSFATIASSVTTSTNTIGAGATELGHGYAYNTSAASTNGADHCIVVAHDNKNLKMIIGSPGAAGQSIAFGSGRIGLTGNVWFSFTAEFDVEGWSSNVQMNSDTDTRVVEAILTHTANLTTNANANHVFTSILSDTHGAYNSSTGLYTVPVSGWYRFSIAGSITSGASTSLYLTKNGSAYARMLDANTATRSASLDVQCVAGDTLALVPDVTYTQIFNGLSGAATGIRLILSIGRISGPSVVAASEKVYAVYKGLVAANASLSAPLQWSTKEQDSHAAVTTGSAWKFTAPKTGMYSFTGSCNAGNAIEISVFKNGTQYGYVGYAPTSQIAAFSGGIYLLAGEYIDFRTTSSQTMTATGICYVTIQSQG